MNCWPVRLLITAELLSEMKHVEHIASQEVKVMSGATPALRFAPANEQAHFLYVRYRELERELQLRLPPPPKERWRIKHETL